MKRNIIFGLILLLAVATFSAAQAATINISNNCNQNVTVSAYSTQVANVSDRLVEKLAYAHNSYTVTTTLPVKCIKTTYPQPGNSTQANYFYFGGANHITVKIGADNNDCTISVTE